MTRSHYIPGPKKTSLQAALPNQTFADATYLLIRPHDMCRLLRYAHVDEVITPAICTALTDSRTDARSIRVKASALEEVVSDYISRSPALWILYFFFPQTSHLNLSVIEQPLYDFGQWFRSEHTSVCFKKAFLFLAGDLFCKITTNHP
ncbi:hypothetical protein IC229_11120 [Spirosoma sp. BT702]|uniref:Uncharacterized protein n=1 Tax=Spirosoma profusum TaxID=2771354 RepID=A0A927AN61_9BACT|nr:hypothetical protein [Spirosoma profusum]MBD2701189.1 hypothetical protein [Spirosoma profusum]